MEWAIVKRWIKGQHIVLIFGRAHFATTLLPDNQHSIVLLLFSNSFWLFFIVDKKCPEQYWHILISSTCRWGGWLLFLFGYLIKVFLTNCSMYLSYASKEENKYWSALLWNKFSSNHVKSKNDEWTNPLWSKIISGQIAKQTGRSYSTSDMYLWHLEHWIFQRWLSPFVTDE